MIANFPYVTAILLMIFGLYAALFRRNLIKIAIGITLMESGVNLFLVSLGYRRGGIAPIYTLAPEAAERMVLPTPQALTLTSIVIGLATTAVLLALIVVIYRHYGTLDADKVNKLRG
ncbi:MAG: cation:proton antiporter subunit C [Candidatus Acetothermia bacterium]|jgi:multicomponent Na+:H+ antiporter subunit C|nr:cation:proton antiporter subunit C [Candidatus Acetothermia bacterium]MDH7505633.1 cation:proton antiporter subunit C [Candidatus Acetothermia bacterium]